MKKDQNQFELSIAVQLECADSSKTPDERAIFIKKLMKKIEATIRDSMSNPVRQDDGIILVRSVKVINEGFTLQEISDAKKSFAEEIRQTGR